MSQFRHTEIPVHQRSQLQAAIPLLAAAYGTEAADAHYHFTRDDLLQFASALLMRVAPPPNEAAIIECMADALLSCAHRPARANPPAAEIFQFNPQKVEKAVTAYMTWCGPAADGSEA